MVVLYGSAVLFHASASQLFFFFFSWPEWQRRWRVQVVSSHISQQLIFQMTVPCKSLLNADILGLWLQGSRNWRGSVVVFQPLHIYRQNVTEVFDRVGCSLCVFVLVAKAMRSLFIQVFTPSPTTQSSDPLSSSASTRSVFFKVAGMLGRILISQTICWPCPEQSPLLYSSALWEFVWASQIPVLTFSSFLKNNIHL